MGEEAPTGRRVSRARQLADRARLMKEARAQKLPGPHCRETFSSVRKERRNSALRRSISSPIKGAGDEIVLLDEQNTPSTVKNVLQRAALARQSHEGSSAGEIVFANGVNMPMTLSPMDSSESVESPQKQQNRKDERAAFVRRGSVGEYGGPDSFQAASMFRQHSNIPFGHMAASAAAAAAATGGTAWGAAVTPGADRRTGECSPSLVVSPHSTVSELEQKLRALAARDKRLGRMLGEAMREQRPEAERTSTDATAAPVTPSSQVATGDRLGVEAAASRSHAASNRERQTGSDTSLIEAEVDGDSEEPGAHAASDTASDTRLSTASARAGPTSEPESATAAVWPEPGPDAAMGETSKCCDSNE